MATRAHVLGLLQRELAAAENVGEVVYAAQLRAKIALMSAGSPSDPARETLSAPEREEVTGERPVRSRRPRAAG